MRCLGNPIDNPLEYEKCATILVEDKEWLVIRVQDQSLGIPESEFERVFGAAASRRY